MLQARPDCVIASARAEYRAKTGTHCSCRTAGPRREPSTLAEAVTWNASHPAKWVRNQERIRVSESAVKVSAIGVSVDLPR